MSLKTIKLYGHDRAPNPWKIEILFGELGLAYEKEELQFDQVKQPQYEAINPNGRLPAIEDPNTGLTVWESGAIIQYLVATYDKEHKLDFTSPAEKWAATQWLFFQVSGQGPYFGQATWFKNFHPEKLPGVIDRYQNEIRRVTMVLDRHLADKEWLVGGKCSYADLSFIPWYWALVGVGEEFIAALTKDYPNWSAWNERLNARPVVKKAAETRRANFTAKQGQLQRGGFSNVK